MDDLPFGAGLEGHSKGKLNKEPLPEGVHHKTLYKDIVRIAWPSFVELVLTQLTGMVDQMMVGHLPGEIGVQALAAVGLSAQPKFLLMTMVQAMNVGATAVVARFRGKGDREGANRVFKIALIFNLLLSVLFTVSGLLFAPQLVHLISGENISGQTFAFALDYFRIQMMGFVPFCMTFTVTAVLRGTGDTKTPLVYNTIANVINILFNYLLIFGKFGFPEMQVQGASLATVIGQTVAFFIAFGTIMTKSRYIYLSLREKFQFDRHILADIVRIGIPSMMEQLFMRLGVIVYTRTITGLGDISYATHQVCMNIQAMSFMTGQAFANAATTLMGQSLGKKRIEMAQHYTEDTRNISMVVSVFIGAALVIWGGNVVGLYNSNPEVIAVGRKLLIMIGLIQPFQSIQFVYAGALRGAGDTRYPAVVIFITVFIVRSGLAVLLINVLGFDLLGAWYALVADQLLRSLLMLVHYYRGNWRFIKIYG